MSHIDVRTQFKPDSGRHIKYQYTINQRCVIFSFGMASSRNIIVYTCYKKCSWQC